MAFSEHSISLLCLVTEKMALFVTSVQISEHVTPLWNFLTSEILRNLGHGMQICGGIVRFVYFRWEEHTNMFNNYKAIMQLHATSSVRCSAGWLHDTQLSLAVYRRIKVVSLSITTEWPTLNIASGNRYCKKPLREILRWDSWLKNKIASCPRN